MDENILDSTDCSEEIGVSDSEIIEDDTITGTDIMESVSDTVSGDDNSTDNTDIVSLPVDRYNEEIGGYPVYIVNDESENLSEDDVMRSGRYSDYYSFIPNDIAEYFSGVLASMKDTDYYAYYLRDYTSDSYNSYVDYYRLVYDIGVDGDTLISGNYPCIEITKSYESNYNRSDFMTNVTSVPNICYGSFGTLSDLRKGVSHDETYAFLFIAGFFICSFVLHNLFSCLHKSK